MKHLIYEHTCPHWRVEDIPVKGEDANSRMLVLVKVAPHLRVENVMEGRTLHGTSFGMIYRESGGFWLPQDGSKLDYSHCVQRLGVENYYEITNSDGPAVFFHVSFDKKVKLTLFESLSQCVKFMFPEMDIEAKRKETFDMLDVLSDEYELKFKLPAMRASNPKLAINAMRLRSLTIYSLRQAPMDAGKDLIELLQMPRLADAYLWLRESSKMIKDADVLIKSENTKHYAHNVKTFVKNLYFLFTYKDTKKDLHETRTDFGNSLEYQNEE